MRKTRKRTVTPKSNSNGNATRTARNEGWVPRLVCIVAGLAVAVFVDARSGCYGPDVAIRQQLFHTAQYLVLVGGVYLFEALYRWILNAGKDWLKIQVSCRVQLDWKWIAALAGLFWR